MKDRLYRFTRPIITFIMKVFYRVKIEGQENIPLEGKFVLAGNHKHNLDCLLLISSTKRTIRFLAKKELLDKHPWIFLKMGIIPVDRSMKNKEAIIEAESVLNNNGVIGIFPEGTFNDTAYIVRPFKIGAVKIAQDTNSQLIPFAIKGEYKFLRKNVKIVFGKGYQIRKKADLKQENNILMNKVIDLLKEK